MKRVKITIFCGVKFSTQNPIRVKFVTNCMSASKEYTTGCNLAKSNNFKKFQKKILNNNDTSPKKKFQLLKNVTNSGKDAGTPPGLAVRE